GHAQFAEDTDIGWFRSDEQFTVPNKEQRGFWNPDTQQEEFFEDGAPEVTKTRRILEIQSDLFQKGRDKEDLAITTTVYDSREENPNFIKEVDKQNQFLQLLNKNNNWVTFFVKSIIQDSAKKGYEKVLFPKGDTAAKIEGHQTLEEFKKQKKDRLL